MATQHLFAAALVLVGLGWCRVAAAQPVPAAAGERCEAAVAETVKRMRGKQAQEIQFVGAKRVLAPTKGGDDIDVKGEGRYRAGSGGTSVFSYSCLFNSHSGATSGVLFRETGAATPAGGSDVAWQPDLSQLSPENCESAAASVLKDKYPRVGRIVFDGESRQLRPSANSNGMLEGQGAVERAAGMNLVPFRYRCEFETRSGKVVSASTAE
ncbi:MAG TPA: hypothetical protein VKI18_03110 [Albitalea sp.]|nr:hypothetical protein [Albitalea sp.]